MKKICFIAAMKSTSAFNIMVDGLKTICENKYDFNVITLCDENIGPNFKMPKQIKFVKVENGMSVNQKIQKGFEFAKGYDLTIIMDYYDDNWRDYVQKMIEEYEKGSDIVYVRKYKTPSTFFGKVAHFFKKIGNAIYQSFIKMVSKNDDLRVFNSFQLFEKNISDIIVTMPEKNTFLRNFDCWNGYKITYVNSDVKEKNKQQISFSKKNVFSIIASFTFIIALIITTAICYNKVDFSFRFTFIAIAFVIVIFLLYLSLYLIFKEIFVSKLGTNKQVLNKNEK